VADRGARATIGGRNHDRLDSAVAELGVRAQAVVVDAEDVESLRRFFAEGGPITDLVVTVTRRGGAGPVSELPDVDLFGAFAGKTVAHLRAVALALPTLSADGSITLVTAGDRRLARRGRNRMVGRSPWSRPDRRRSKRSPDAPWSAVTAKRTTSPAHRRPDRPGLHHGCRTALRRRAAPHLTRAWPGGTYPAGRADRPEHGLED
jgi:hypothetical protein